MMVTSSDSPPVLLPLWHLGASVAPRDGDRCLLGPQDSPLHRPDGGEGQTSSGISNLYVWPSGAPYCLQR